MFVKIILPYSYTSFPAISTLNMHSTQGRDSFAAPPVPCNFVLLLSHIFHCFGKQNFAKKRATQIFFRFSLNTTIKDEKNSDNSLKKLLKKGITKLMLEQANMSGKINSYDFTEADILS